MTPLYSLLRITESPKIDENADEAIRRREQRRRQLRAAAKPRMFTPEKDAGQKLLNDFLRQDQTARRNSDADSKLPRQSELPVPAPMSEEPEQAVGEADDLLFGDKDVQAYLKASEEDSKRALEARVRLRQRSQAATENIAADDSRAQAVRDTEALAELPADPARLHDDSSELAQREDAQPPLRQNKQPPLTDLASAAQALDPDRRMIEPEHLVRHLADLGQRLAEFIGKREYDKFDASTLADAQAQHDQLTDSLDFLEGYAEASHDAETIRQTIAPAIESLRLQLAADRSRLEQGFVGTLPGAVSQQLVQVAKQGNADAASERISANKRGSQLQQQEQGHLDDLSATELAAQRTRHERIAESLAGRRSRAELKDKEKKDQTLPLAVQRSV